VRKLTVPLARMPVFARDGTVLPLQDYRAEGDATPPTRLIVETFPGRRGAFTLYEDEGDGLAYRRGRFARTRISQRRRRGTAVVVIGRARGTYAGRPRRRSYELRIFGALRPRAVIGRARRLRHTAPGAARGWWYDSALGAVVVRTARLSTARAARVVVRER
jgi:hypothetical protein